MANRAFHFITAVLLVFMLSGCGIIDYFYLPPGEDTAQELFEAGNDSMREKDYASAANYYSKLKDNFPFSPYAIEAELSLADCYFLDEEWAEASEAYQEFEELHPRHESIPYVLYQIGMSNINGHVSIDRPITPIEEAFSYFERLYVSYPGTEYAIAAEAKMAECRRLMAESELYYGDFYYRQGRYVSALSRYEYILDNFRDVPEIYDHAALKAKSAFIKSREKQGEKTREEREGSMWDWLKKKL